MGPSDVPIKSFEHREDALKHIDDLILSGRQFLRTPLELPEPSARLEIESRQHNETRLFKHLHQGCMLHAEAFRRTNQIKLVYVLEAYATMTKKKNPLGIYAMARSLLEFAGFVTDVNRRLRAVREQRNSWRDRGPAFFKVIVRARFATSNPEIKRVIMDQGMSEDDTKPFHIMTCIENVSKHHQFSWFKSHYDFLCDYVHHNLSSQTVAAARMRTGQFTPAGGGALMTPALGPQVTYAYEVEAQSDYALSETAARAAMSAELALHSINTLPYTPYTESEVLSMTGHRLGVTELPRPPRPDDPCFCRSGMKYGRCHGKGKP